MRRWRATCASSCASGSRPATATAGDDFLVARYGEFVLLKPQFAWDTLLLWLSPFVLLVIGAIGFVRAGRRQTAPAADKLSPDEEARVAALVKPD